MFFGALGMSTLRMKYLWTPYMCILGSIGISDYKVWRTILSPFKTQGVIVRVYIQSYKQLLTHMTLTDLKDDSDFQRKGHTECIFMMLKSCL